MEDFKVGDVVELKSGSPKMTIEKTEVWKSQAWDDTYANCVWFDENNKPQNRDFKKEALKISS